MQSYLIVNPGQGLGATLGFGAGNRPEPGPSGVTAGADVVTLGWRSGKRAD